MKDTQVIYIKAITKYLRGKGFVSPTEIGNIVGERLTHNYQHSAWASPKCKMMVGMGILTRDRFGHYALITKRGKYDR